jgi:Uma2 family endonuclease
MVMPQTRQWTAEEVRALIREDQPWPRYELIDGELLVTPAPGNPHQFAVAELLLLLNPYADENALGVVLVSPADLELKPGTITQPDVFVVPAGSVVKGSGDGWAGIKSLLLAVEILSASSLHTDRVTKRDLYLTHQVAEYWVMDLDQRQIERWMPGDVAPTIIRDAIAWAPRNGLAPLVIDLPDVFARIDRKLRLVGLL